LTAVPAKKARRRIKEKVNTLLYRGNPTPWPELRQKLNRLLAGWANYYSFGWTAGADGALWWHTYQRVRRFLCKRHKLPTQGTSRFSVAEVFGPVGVLDLPRYRKRRAAHASS
jgi:RNA-directed DNA polymerase